jgi:uncharacterized protein
VRTPTDLIDRIIRENPRAAMYAKRLREQGAIELDSGQAYALAVALEEHDQGKVSDPRESPDQATIAVCWDADRLQLPRVGITPDPALMSTEAGRRACTQV